MSKVFVFCACGDRHVERINITLSFLKRFSINDIVVVTSRTTARVEHDQVLSPEVPRQFDDHQASILLKTSLHRIIGNRQNEYCYLDSDVVAVNYKVDSIFDHKYGPVTFAKDHVCIDNFSRYAVKCPCVTGECDHLRASIRRTFGIDVPDPQWVPWNGGVFLFNNESGPFMDLWHQYTLLAFDDTYWKTRDQGTLIATVWQFGLQHQGTLPKEFNYIIDPFWSHASNQRAGISVQDYYIHDGYSLNPSSTKTHPAFLHCINGGIGKRGWKNWDEIESLLQERDECHSVRHTITRQHGVEGNGHTKLSGITTHQQLCQQVTEERGCQSVLSSDNKIVHGMWVGQKLSKLELLTLHSFINHGHEFHLWVYDEIKTPLPAAVVLEDATQVIPRNAVFKKENTDPETGVGKGSYGAPFSDLFRYKLLYEKGGYWVDMDVTCLHPLDFEAAYVFRTHRVGVVGNVMKCPPGSHLMLSTYNQVLQQANKESAWLMPNRVLSENIVRSRMTEYIRDDICNEDSWLKVIRPFVEQDAPIPRHLYVIHWINEFWRTLKHSGGKYRGIQFLDYVPDKERPKKGSTLAKLYAIYGL